MGFCEKTAQFTRKLAFLASSKGAKGWLGYLAIFLVYFIPPLVLAVIIISSAMNGLTDLAVLQYQQKLTDFSEYTHSQVHRIVDYTQVIAQNEDFIRLVEAGNWRGAMQVAQVFQLNNQGLPINRIMITNFVGDEKAAYPELSGGVGNNFSYRDWYNGVLATGQPYISSVYQRTAEPQIFVVTVGVPIVNDNNTVLGILAVQLSALDLLEHMRKISIDKSYIFYLYDQQGHLLDTDPSTGTLVIRNLSDEITSALKQNTQYVKIQKKEGEEKLFAYKSPHELGLGVALSHGLSSAFAFRDHFITTLVVLLGLVVLFYWLLVKPIVLAITWDKK